MRLKTKLLIVMACGLLPSFGLAQAQDKVPKVIPPSPNAAAIQRYGDIPVSPYTGTPNISIPLYEVKSGEISVPISISYNASGIKVADEASRVGLGWVLNAGGVISRNVIGRDDWEDYHSQTSFEIPLGPKYHQGYTFNYAFNCLHTINGYQLPEVLLNDQLSDFQPDHYSYNFSGHAGKFVLRRNKDAVLNNVEKIDIKVLDNNANAWEIKTPDGFLYRFEDIEYYIDGSQQRKSSWYLSKITSPTGREVHFVYTTLIQDIQPTGSYFESMPVGFLAVDGLPPLPPYYSSTVPAKTYHSLYLSKIISDDAEVQFNYSTGRIDVVNDVQINSISIYAKRPDGGANTLLKSWNFTYSYFTSIGGVSNPTYPDLHFKRLKLASLQETSSVTSLPPYVFYYNETISLPGKLSFARDHWGYFNGKVNSSLIPTFYGGGGGGSVNPGAMGPERNPDPDKSQAFILNKIQYPTGGFTQFEYESNDFDITKSIINDYSFFATYLPAVPAIREVNFPNTLAGGTFTATLDLTNLYPTAQEVTIGAAWGKSSGFPPGSTAIMDITCSLKDPSGAEIGGGQIASWLGSSSPPMTTYLGTSQQNSGVSITLKKALTPGIYTWTFFVPASYGVQSSNVYVSYTKAENSDPILSGGELVYNALFGGGVRIKKITDYTDDLTIANVRKYNYHYQLNGKTYSYGRSMAKPNYSYYDIVGNSGARAPCLMRESDSNIPLNGSTNGMPVGYDKVEELFGENGENGKNLYEYWNQTDKIWDYRTFFNSTYEIPLKPPYGGTMPDVANGSLLNQSTYANVGGQFVKKSEVINTFQDISNLFSGVVYGIDKRVVSDQTVPGQECGKLSFFIYPSLAINRPVLTTSVSKLYDGLNATASLTTTTEYTYNNTTHLQLATKSQYKSNGDKTTTSFTYPADYSDAECDAALLQMKGTSFMHSLPVTQQVAIIKGTDQFLSGSEITKYQILNGKVLPKERVVLETARPININTPPTAYNPASSSYPSGYVPRLFFDAYDASGNILQMHKSNDGSLSYLWGYNKTYPIAEVTNAFNKDVAYTSFEEDSKGNWSYSGPPQADLSSLTGSYVYNLANGVISVTLPAPVPGKRYILTYWTKDNSGNVLLSGLGNITRTNKHLGNWAYTENSFFPSGAITISGTATIDELRLYPEEAQMTTYTYDPLIGMTSKCDAGNKTTYYEYDDLGRLKLIRDLNKKILKTFDYRYQQ